MKNSVIRTLDYFLNFELDADFKYQSHSHTRF